MTRKDPVIFINQPFSGFLLRRYIEGFMRNLFGRKASEAAVGAADSVLDAMLDVLKPDRQSYSEEISAAVADVSATSPPKDKAAPSAAAVTPVMDSVAFAEGDGADSMARKDPAELRKRMDDIKNEMVAVAEQMAEMERRLLEQQANLVGLYKLNPVDRSLKAPGFNP
jgi:hypothetical protein